MATWTHLESISIGATRIIIIITIVIIITTNIIINIISTFFGLAKDYGVGTSEQSTPSSPQHSFPTLVLATQAPEVQVQLPPYYNNIIKYTHFQVTLSVLYATDCFMWGCPQNHQA